MINNAVHREALYGMGQRVSKMCQPVYSIGKMLPLEVIAAVHPYRLSEKPFLYLHSNIWGYVDNRTASVSNLVRRAIMEVHTLRRPLRRSLQIQ